MTTEYNIEKLKQLLAIEVFKERYYNKIFDLLNTQLQLISAPLAAPEQPPPPLPPLPGTAPSSPSLQPSPPSLQPSLQPSPPAPSSPSLQPSPPLPPSPLPPSPPSPAAAAEQAAESKENNVNVIFVRVKFDENEKKYITNQEYGINFNNIFNDLTIEDLSDLYKSDKSDKYVKYHTNNNIKYIICIEPDFTENNDDTLKLVNDLYNILNIIYSSIIEKFKELKVRNSKLKLILSVPSINDSDVSIINKKTILGCFSKIYKNLFKKKKF